MLLEVVAEGVLAPPHATRDRCSAGYRVRWRRVVWRYSWLAADNLAAPTLAEPYVDLFSAGQHRRHNSIVIDFGLPYVVVSLSRRVTVSPQGRPFLTPSQMPLTLPGPSAPIRP